MGFAVVRVAFEDAFRDFATLGKLLLLRERLGQKQLSTEIVGRFANQFPQPQLRGRRIAFDQQLVGRFGLVKDRQHPLHVGQLFPRRVGLPYSVLSSQVSQAGQAPAVPAA